MKNLIIKSVVMSAIVFFGAVSVHAQNKHEISFSGFGGLSGLKYDVTAGSQKSGFGGGFGLGYAMFFSEHVGVRTGVELGFFGAKYNAVATDLKYTAKDVENTSFEFRSRAGAYEETQSAMMLQIPLMLQYQTGKFYAALGGKVGIPASAKYKTGAMTVQNSGFYAQENYEYTTQTFMGFGSFNLSAAESDLTLKTAVFLSVEIGGKFWLSNGLALYAGVFVDYGLSSVVETGRATSPLIEYNTQTPHNFVVNSALNAGYIDKINPIAAGVKLRFAIGKGGL